MGKNISTAPCRRFGKGVKSTRFGFTLIELITGITIVGILSTITVVGVSKAKTYSESTRAVAGARVLINAFLSHNIENSGNFMVGYDLSPVAHSSIGRQTLTRYPYRLSPYYGDSYQGPMWVNGNKEQIDEKGEYAFDRQYGYSMHPAFGMNYFFVGGKNAVVGYEDSGAPVYGPDNDSLANAILHGSDAESQVIVFASSGRFNVDGWHLVTPPQFYAASSDSRPWSSTRNWSPSSNPENYGYVNARYDGKAVVAQLGGSVQLLTIEELNDMRLWSRNAILANDSHYQPIASAGNTPPPPPRR